MNSNGLAGKEAFLLSGVQEDRSQMTVADLGLPPITCNSQVKHAKNAAF